MQLEQSNYGTTESGNEVTKYTLTNSAGSFVELIDYGAIITSVNVPDRDGKLANINLGFDDLAGYESRHPYYGATVGRFCNRIAKGHFSLDGKDYELVINNGPNHLHGGTIGFDKKMWSAEEFQAEGLSGVRFRMTSEDGDEGYPGTLHVVAEYSWSEDGELTYTFRATAESPTVLNLTNHSYWNLSGAGSGNVFDHQLKLNCDQYLEVDESLIPTGKMVDAKGTPLDFSDFQRVVESLDQLPATKGYDHCYVVNGDAGELRLCGTVKDPGSGRQMEVLTTQPGVQFYTGNHLGDPYAPYSGLCLETQHYPDSPNQAEFPTTRLEPGEEFEETTTHRFSTFK